MGRDSPPYRGLSRPVSQGRDISGHLPDMSREPIDRPRRSAPGRRYRGLPFARTVAISSIETAQAATAAPTMTHHRWPIW